MTASELELAERAARGDRAAVAELFERHLPALEAWVRLRRGPRLRAVESACDVLQSTCRDLLENLENFRFPSEGAFRAWLYRTAERKIADRAEYWNAERRDPARLVPPPAVAGESTAPDAAQVFAVYASVCSPSELAMGNEARERFESAFARLADADREIILLARIAGLSHAEIGETLGIAPGTARMRLFRALGELSEVLRAQ